MLERKSYTNPPLVEVLSEFHFVPVDGKSWDALGLHAFYEAIGGAQRFPERRDAGEFRRTLPSDSRKSAARRRRGTPRMWQFISGDGNTVVQIGEDGLAVNQLPPYYGWERYVEEARRAIAAYLAVWPARLLDRAGLHYLDSVAIPGAAIDIASYFNLYPVLPEELGKAPLLDLAMSCELNGERDGETLAFSLRRAELATTEPHVGFRLTWDYRLIEPLPTELAAIVAFLDRAHRCASEAFRASLTAKCAALFEME